MASHITVIPASSRAGRETIRHLLNTTQTVSIRGIYRDPTKAPTEFTQDSRFEAAKGDVATNTGLDFSKSEAVLYVPPPTFDGTDQLEFAALAARNIEAALNHFGVKRLVLHSALGAHHENGIGTLKINYIADKILGSAAPQVVIVKPGWYFEMWGEALKSVQAGNSTFESPFSPADYKIPQVSVVDVGEYCAKALLENLREQSPHIADMVGPRDYSSTDIKNAIEEITAKEVKLVALPKDKLAEFFAKEVPGMYVPEFVEMIESIVPGGVIARDPGFGSEIVRGKTELVDALRPFASL